jgi:hypothetical protein
MSGSSASVSDGSTPPSPDSPPEEASHHRRRVIRAIGPAIQVDAIVGFADCGASLIALCSSPRNFEFFIGYNLSPWSQVDISNPPPVRGHFSTAKVSENEFLIIGGDTPTFELFQVNIFTGECEMMTIISKPIPALTKHASASMPFRGKTLVYVFGGYRGTCLSPDLLLLTIKNNIAAARDWTDAQGPLPRTGHTLTYYRGDVYLFGGRGPGGVLFDDFWCLGVSASPVNPKWRRIVGPGPSPRASHTSWTDGASHFVAGGVDSEGHFLNEIWQFRAGWEKVGLFDRAAKVIGCSQGLCVLGTEFAIARAHDPLDKSFARLAAKRDRFVRRQTAHDRLYLETSRRLTELVSVLQATKARKASRRPDELVTADRLSSLERELAELGFALVQKFGEFFTTARTVLFKKPPVEPSVKSSILRPYLLSLVSFEEQCRRFRESQERMSEAFHSQTFDALSHRLRGPIPEIAGAEADDELLPYVFSQQLRELEEVESPRREGGDRQQAELVMTVAKMTKAVGQRRATLEGVVKRWRDMVADSERELKRLMTVITFAEDSEKKKGEQIAELEKCIDEAKKAETQLKKEVLEVSVAKKDRIRKLYAATENLSNQYREASLEEARQTFGGTLAEMRELLKSIADVGK